MSEAFITSLISPTIPKDNGPPDSISLVITKGASSPSGVFILPVYSPPPPVIGSPNSFLSTLLYNLPESTS